jgi:hypothetical protein
VEHCKFSENGKSAFHRKDTADVLSRRHVLWLYV